MSAVSRIIAYATFFLCSVPLLAQRGNYFLSHYTPNNKQFDNVCFDLAQDKRGIIHLATKAGILEFDGRNWELTKDIGAVYSLSVSPSGEIFWGGAAGFGILGNPENKFETQRLSKNETKDVFQSMVINDNAYFLNSKTLFIYSSTSKKIIEIPALDVAGSFSGLFELFGQAYVNTEQGSLFRVEKNKLTKSNLNLGNGEEIVFCEGLEDDYLLGTAEGHLYRFGKDFQFHQIILEDKDYAQASVIVNGVRVNKQLVALGTLRGGVMFINSSTGKTEEIINYNTGLPDNEVFAMMRDQNKNIWVAHDYGFTCIAPYVPLRSFNYYNGLEGNLLCAISFHNQVYVGTSLGLFKLEKEELYDEITYYVDVEVKSNPKNEKTKNHDIAAKQEEEIKQLPVKEPESKKKGFFSFLRRNKNKQTEPEKIKIDDPKESEKLADIEKENKSAPKYIKEKRTQRILRSSNFMYTKIKGINAKVTQLIDVNGKLLAAGLAGVHEMNGLVAKPLLEEPVHFVYANRDFLHVATYDDKVKSWLLSDKNWTPTSLLGDIDDDINYMFEGDENELWLCSRAQVYRAEIVDKKLKKIHTLDLGITNADRAVGIHWNGQTIFANAEGFFNYNHKKSSFTKVDSLPKPSMYFAWKNTIWYRAPHGWKSLGVTTDQSNLQLLNLFQDLRFISSDEHDSSFWLITGNNELFKFFGGKLHQHESGYPLILKSISNGRGNILYRSEIKVKIKIDEQPSSLSIEVVKPDYIGSQSLEYRYFLDGLHSGWSEWSTSNNQVDFPYLPPGKYVLSVEARDMFGEIKKLDPLSFIVQPPYWQRPWFYALEFSGFALLVMLSFKLSSRYIIISRLLSLLTIILLIQLIQTVASSLFYSKASPVVDFFVQAIVALLILPVEGYLRRVMFRSYDKNQGIGQLLNISTKKVSDVKGTKNVE